MKKLIAHILIAAALVVIVKAVIIGDYVQFAPSMSTYIYITNKTLDYVTPVIVNETCLVINTTSYCAYNQSDYLYVITTNETVTINCTVINEQIEWVEINCTITGAAANWTFSIIDNKSNESYYVFDTTTGGLKKFWGLKPSKRYVITVNATTNSTTAVDYVTAKTKTGAEDMEIAIIAGLSIIAIIFFVIGLVLFFNRRESG